MSFQGFPIRVYQMIKSEDQSETSLSRHFFSNNFHGFHIISHTITDVHQIIKLDRINIRLSYFEINIDVITNTDCGSDLLRLNSTRFIFIFLKP